jgi:hypothetical protein
MIIDNSSYFSSAQAVTTTANSTNVFDVTGAGSGTSPAMIGANGVNTALGFDIGTGDGVANPHVVVVFNSAAASSNTITVSLEAAPDNGSYSPGTYVQLYASRAFVESTIADDFALVFPVPPILSTSAVPPRFYRLVYTCSGAVTASITAFMVINATSGNLLQKYGSNYDVADL